MNILHIIASVDPSGGGPVEALRAGALAQLAYGVRSEVATLDDPEAPFVRNFPCPVHGQGPAPRRYGHASRLARWIATNAGRFDAAVIHGLWNEACVGGWRGLAKARLPYVVLAHGMMDPWFRKAYPLKHWAKQAVWLAAQGWVLKGARAVLFTSEEERRLAHGAFFGPSYVEKVVAFGAADAPERPGEQRAAFRARMPGLGDRPFLLFLGRLHPKKGCDILLRAFARHADAHPGLDLVIAGPDQLGWNADLEALAAALGLAGRVHWPGMLAGDAKWGALRLAEALVLPSHQENFGMVLAEAMACGTPVLTTDKVNIWREVQASGGGFVEPDRLEGVDRLLERWLALEVAERARMSAAARAGFERHFHIDAAARGLLAVLAGARAQHP